MIGLAALLAALAANPAPATPTPAAAHPAPASVPFLVAGRLTQGGWVRGQAPPHTVSATLDGVPLALDRSGQFFAAFDRDAGPIATLIGKLADGREVRTPITVTPRAWKIEHLNVARRPGGATEAFLALRRPELARIAAARALGSTSEGWRQAMIWPVRARISSVFGSQRVYRGEPAAYHGGLDLAPGAGAAYFAPADGVVTLAAQAPFTLEGNLLIVDHGQGLSSAFLHSSRLAVKEGDVIRQGQLLGYVGATGRVTGPHLHWALMWRGARLDPQLFLPAP